MNKISIYLPLGTIALLWNKRATSVCLHFANLNAETTMTKLKYNLTAETVSEAESETNMRLMDAPHVNTAFSVSKLLANNEHVPRQHAKSAWCCNANSQVC